MVPPSCFRERVRAVSVLSAGLMGFAGTATSYPVVCAGLLLIGGASTIAFSALTSLLMTYVPPAQSGLASGLQNTTRRAARCGTIAIRATQIQAHAQRNHAYVRYPESGRES